MRRFETEGQEGTEALGAALAPLLPPGTLLALDGEMGAGKTALVRGLGRGLGSTDPVASPTFALHHEVAGGRLPLHHMDAWALERGEAFLADGGHEFLRGGPLGTDLAALEWSQRVAAFLPPAYIACQLAHAGPTRRWVELSVRGHDQGLADCLAALPRGGPGFWEIP